VACPPPARSSFTQPEDILQACRLSENARRFRQASGSRAYTPALAKVSCCHLLTDAYSMACVARYHAPHYTRDAAPLRNCQRAARLSGSIQAPAWPPHRAWSGQRHLCRLGGRGCLLHPVPQPPLLRTTKRFSDCSPYQAALPFVGARSEDCQSSYYSRDRRRYGRFLGQADVPARPRIVTHCRHTLCVLRTGLVHRRRRASTPGRSGATNPPTTPGAPTTGRQRWHAGTRNGFHRCVWQAGLPQGGKHQALGAALAPPIAWHLLSPPLLCAVANDLTFCFTPWHCRAGMVERRTGALGPRGGLCHSNCWTRS